MDTYIHDVNRKLSAKRAEYVHCSHRTLNIELCVRSVLCTKWTCFNSFDTFFLERHIYLYTRQWRKPSFTYGAFFFLLLLFWFEWIRAAGHCCLPMVSVCVVFVCCVGNTRAEQRVVTTKTITNKMFWIVDDGCTYTTLECRKCHSNYFGYELAHVIGYGVGHESTHKWRR